VRRTAALWFGVLAVAFDQDIAQWKHPYLRDVASTKWWWRARVVCQFLAVCAALASIALFAWGMVEVEASIGVLNLHADD
jgi:hypothetical protein